MENKSLFHTSPSGLHKTLSYLFTGDNSIYNHICRYGSLLSIFLLFSVVSFLNLSLRFCISSYRSKFLSLGTTGTVGCIILYCGGNARHCRIFSGILGLHPPDAISAAHPPSVITTYHNQKCLQTSPNVL